MAASISPASVIIAVDVVDSRLDLAKELGATHVINPLKIDAVHEIRKLTGGYGADRALDATGNVGVIKDMLACAAPNSIAATVGATAKGVVIEIEPLVWLQRGVSYRGVHQGSSNPQKEGLHLRKIGWHQKSNDLDSFFRGLSTCGKVDGCRSRS
ncbi:hypothetical protein H2200_009533 [Cladophialophora chaetospira]|uniref:Alcohol dehydrogenase-like C-terminal domain-containing protein n=1 Tax=Cladophialophora chaetospira TaxID=386627 RepID=A0AA38X2L4_9EURO|nr:hypothetical protein H2200_009533 [Cladophialophora chaetospira]